MSMIQTYSYALKGIESMNAELEDKLRASTDVFGYYWGINCLKSGQKTSLQWKGKCKIFKKEEKAKELLETHFSSS